MKIGVISDTHGYLDLMRKVVSSMAENHHVDTIIHLGDDSTDVDGIALPSVDIYSVPGIYEPRYRDKGIPNRLIMEFEGVPMLLTHTPSKDAADLEEDIDPTEAIEDGDVKVVLHGHSHHWKIAEEKGVIVINPGHMVPKDEKGARGIEPSFAILELTGKKLNAKIFSLSENLLTEKTFFFEY